ncbi:uncharacterized protein LOC122390810 [Amphibalanus amphitrite]|uniref:uncharacterized protein LOC122390810 n=1 Tax=Amphibalanus amphitrite TaxID=1232801 RepID=UPI001C9198AE|nr:uncharacterized protein LOC122390810 [Amphibalanus amphitrite]
MTTNVTVSLDQVPVMASAVAPTIVPRPVTAPVPVGDGGVTDSATVSQPVVAVPSAPFDARLIPEFDGTEDVVSWLARAEMLCQLRGVAAETVIPLRLAGGAFHVWSQLPAASRCSLTAVRDALQAAFALDEYAAYEAFAARRLMPGESADVFLADLRRLAALFGGVPERALACAFVAGLPDSVRQMIRAGCRADGLDLSSVLARARAVLTDERLSAAAAAALSGALPITRLHVDGRECSVLIDTGSTDTIIYAPFCAQWRRRVVRVTTISGDDLKCSGIGSVTVEAPTGHRAALETLVVEERPLGVDMVLGVSGISALGGVTVLSPSVVRFCGAVCRAPPDIETPDFRVQFNAAARKWSVAWKWSDGIGPQCLTNAVPQYAVPPAARHEFETELDDWIEREWLVPYDERRQGPPKGLVPLMAVEQRNRGKVRPVLDYRELNDFVQAHTADSDVCAEQLRKWRRHGANVAVVDLKRAYLQLHLEERLWPFQTVMVRGQRFCLTRLGFGLNIAPLVMKAVVRAVLDQDPDIGRAVLPYVDDLLVNEDIVSAERVVAHFAQFGLDCKPPERAASGARLLGLRVHEENGQLRWKRGNAVSAPPERVTRRSVFAWCGQLVAHVPVCGWLRPAVAWLKRRVNELTRGWDDITDDAALRVQMDCIASRLASDDPARGVWCVDGDEVVAWTDASSLATGVVLENTDGEVIEDACWLRRDDAVHINMAELDAAIRGINLAVAWGARRIDLRTDSVTVKRWIDDAISGRARLRTKASGELLIRRRVAIIRQLVIELELRLTVALVRSADNRADALTRVPREWLRDDLTSTVSAAAVSAAGEPSADSVCVIQRLEEIFFDRGAPAELLCDNDPVFRGRPFAVLAARWGVAVRFRAAHAPSGNGVIERCHRTVKVIAARKRCDIAEAVHLYNVTPRDGEAVASAPFCGVYSPPAGSS